jgi:RpiR family carbohydrate utilization transcriptional regulator
MDVIDKVAGPERLAVDLPLLDQIRQAEAILRRSERKVADFILTSPQSALSLGISALASASGVSDPTVLRFCRALGYDGFQSFRLALARALALGLPAIREGIGPGDDMISLAAKVCSQSAAAIHGMQSRVDWAVVERAIDCLARAPRIECYGVGASGAVAIDAQHKLIRLSVPVTAYVDPHMQIMSATSLKPGDAVLAFSYTGRAREVIEASQLARRQGASVIAVTTADTPLALVATHALLLPSVEDTENFTPMISRLQQLIMVDIVEIGIALRRGPALVPHLRRMKRALRSARQNPPEI